ncbi:MAG: hypothetical protein WCJ09_00675 [Planctomycetota bacterium]
MRIATVRILIACLIFCTTLPCIAGWFSRSCSKCGCGELEKVCRVVPDVKKVTETKFVVDCEDICLPGKSCTEERMVSDACVAGGQRCEKVSVPTCDRIVTKKKLKKVTTTVDKPGWKCVVDTICSQCGHNCGTANCGK